MCLLSTREEMIRVLVNGLLKKNGLKCLSYKPYEVYRASCDERLSWRLAPTYASLIRYVLDRLYEAGYFQHRIVRTSGRKHFRYVYVICSGELYDAIKRKDAEKVRQIIESVL